MFSLTKIFTIKVYNFSYGMMYYIMVRISPACFDY